MTAISEQQGSLEKLLLCPLWQGTPLRAVHGLVQGVSHQYFREWAALWAGMLRIHRRPGKLLVKYVLLRYGLLWLTPPVMEWLGLERILMIIWLRLLSQAFQFWDRYPGKCSRGCAVWPAQNKLLSSAVEDGEDGGLGFFRIQNTSLGKDWEEWIQITVMSLGPFKTRLLG